jgi:ubiquinone/menaquinone biosynthesis C-methylase UbiE
VKLNWAERWAVNNPLRPLQQRLEMEWFRRRVRLETGARVLEVGCGRGAGARLIKTLYGPACLQAMDLDIVMIEKAGRYLSAEARRGISFYVGDVSRLPHGDGSLDAVFGFGVLHHIPCWQKALAEIVRVLKVGGVYCFEELYPSLYQNALTRHLLLHPAENRFRSGDFKRAMEAAGLTPGGCLEHKKLAIIGIATKR